MKNKESKRPSTASKSMKQNKNSTQKIQKRNEVSKTQLERLKKFYNTTRWLPNSAFTTFFGKPAFANYGYGNTNPVYGGLFYGNYMLSHNMNPIDGLNHPEEKQVYSSAMMKSLQRQPIRRPSPPRKTPEEIRNTPEEIKEMNTRKQIFQLPNEFPTRDIIPPNLVKCKYFRSGGNTPVDSEDENEDEYEVFDVENALRGKKNKKKKIDKTKLKSNFNPYTQGKVQLAKKKMKENLDTKISEDLLRKGKKGNLGEYPEGYEQEEEDEETREYNMKKRYYEEMLGEDGLKNLEDLKELNIKTKEQVEEEKQQKEFEQKRLEILRKKAEEQEREDKMNADIRCPYCSQTQRISVVDLLKKKDNPALYAPGELPLDGTGTGMLPCPTHSQEMNSEGTGFKPQKFYSTWLLSQTTPAGKPSRKEEPLNLFK